MEVWLTERAGSLAREVYGTFTSPDKGKEQCQKVANEFFGEKLTKPLHWHGDNGYQTASHSDPGGQYLFTVTRFTLDEICD